MRTCSPDPQGQADQVRALFVLRSEARLRITPNRMLEKSPPRNEPSVFEWKKLKSATC
jgi:hypothetical protein